MKNISKVKKGKVKSFKINILPETEKENKRKENLIKNLNEIYDDISTAREYIFSADEKVVKISEAKNEVEKYFETADAKRSLDVAWHKLADLEELIDEAIFAIKKGK